MEQISELMAILSGILNWNKARLDCLCKILLALIKVRTVNLREVAVALSGSAQIDSRYKRLNRFFGHFKIDILVITRWLFKLFYPDNKPVYLIIDRTNWYWGKEKINIFLLSAAYEGIAIPLFWVLLDKAGSSSAEEQIDLISRFLQAFPSIKIEGLLADREFGNGDFFRWLIQKKISFYIRIKEDSIVRIKKKRLYAAKKLFSGVHARSHKAFHLQVEIFGQKVYLAGSRSEKGELMIVATNAKVKQAIAIYLRRWEIECLFASLKGRGFRFEETHLTRPERIEKLIAILAIAFCLAHKVGEWRSNQRAIRMNRHRDSRRPQYSFFRYGFDFIRDILFQPVFKADLFRECLYEFISPPEPTFFAENSGGEIFV